LGSNPTLSRPKSLSPLECPQERHQIRGLLRAGKQMIYDLVEAETGKYVSSFDLGKEFGLQNIVTNIDPDTGAKAVDESLVPGDGTTKTICPHVDGGRDWMPTSYNPATKLLYIPVVEACMDLVPTPKGERGSLSTRRALDRAAEAGQRWQVRPLAGPERRDEDDGMGRPAAGADHVRCACDCGRSGVCRWPRSDVPRL
jgi:hypothetical protein